MSLSLTSGRGYSCISPWRPPSLHPSWARDASVLVLKSICQRVQQLWRWGHWSCLCCQCVSSSLRRHCPMLLIGNCKTLEKAPAIWKGTFPLLRVLLYLYSKRKWCLRKNVESVLVHLDFHSGKKEQWEGNRILSLWFILLELNFL